MAYPVQVMVRAVQSRHCPKPSILTRVLYRRIFLQNVIFLSRFVRFNVLLPIFVYAVAMIG